MLQLKETCIQCPLATGLTQVLENQLTTWRLTKSEKAVCHSLLAGKSLRQIAEERGTNDTTVRQQALAIYAKAGVEGRAELSAHFLRVFFYDVAKT